MFRTVVGKNQDLFLVVAVISILMVLFAPIPAVLLERVMTHLRQPPDSILYGLTPRELDVLRLLAGGWTTRAMAGELGVTFHTIRNYVQAVIQKLGAHSRLEAVAIALRDGVVAAPER